MIYAEQYRKIYETAFGRSSEFDTTLFGRYSDRLCYISESGKAVAAFFLLPCFLEKKGIIQNAHYLYAAATAPDSRGQGFMTRLIKQVCRDCTEPIFLKPADSSLIKFYSERGFSAVNASPFCGEYKLLCDFPELSALCKPEQNNFIVMYHKPNIKIKSICFADTLD